jgi:D-alanyl-D-alanine carboxypeptidase/D-alanyl-D-alanine-endopeptidase (penicillin-binding protein 4)
MAGSIFVATLIAFGAPVRADLNHDIRQVLGDPLLGKTETGIEIIRLGDAASHDAIIYRLNSDIPLVPASNLKLLTTSATLDHLGSDFKFHTLLVRHGDDLILVGDGDPTLGDTELLRRVGWDVTTVFRDWARELVKHGITKFDNLRVDDSVFDMQFLHPHWPLDQAHKWYMAEVGGLSLNANCIDFFIKPMGGGQVVSYSETPVTAYAHVRNNCLSGGDNAIWLTRQLNTNQIVLRGSTPYSNEVSVTIHDPPMFAGTVLAETLKAGGVTMSGQVVRDRTVRTALASPGLDHSQWTLLAVHETPLPQVLARTNKDSMNVYAESLCKRLAFDVTGRPGNWADGTQAVGAFLKKVGVSDSEYHLDDGCGLSKENTVSAHALVSVMAYDYFSRNKPAFFNSLAIAGSDGTLEKRFTNDLRGRVFGKSGFVNGVSALSGYLHTRDDQWYVFSILMNGIPPGSNSGVKPLQEQIVRAIEANLSPKVAAGR